MFSKIFTTVKYTLVTVNFLFLITGIIILSVGASVQSAYNNYHHFLSERFFSLPAFCIATGIIIFFIAGAGFYGAFMENYYMNMAFAGSMIVIFIFQISACIAGYALRSNTAALVQQQLQETQYLYGPDKNFEVTKLWDEVQKDFECCGVISANDWVIPLNSTADGGLPITCCGNGYGIIHTFNCTITSASVFKIGCAEAFGDFVKSHAASIAIAGIFLVIMQALAVAGALWMAKISREERGAYP